MQVRVPKAILDDSILLGRIPSISFLDSSKVNLLSDLLRSAPSPSSCCHIYCPCTRLKKLSSIHHREVPSCSICFNDRLFYFFRNLKVVHVSVLIPNEGIKKADPKGLNKETSKFGLDESRPWNNN
jgi:hypothetical protein